MLENIKSVRNSQKMSGDLVWRGGGKTSTSFVELGHMFRTWQDNSATSGDFQKKLCLKTFLLLLQGIEIV